MLNKMRKNKIIPKTFVILMLRNTFAFYIVLGWSLLRSKSHKQTYKWHSDQNIDIVFTRHGLPFFHHNFMFYFIGSYSNRNGKKKKKSENLKS